MTQPNKRNHQRHAERNLESNYVKFKNLRQMRKSALGALSSLLRTNQGDDSAQLGTLGKLLLLGLLIDILACRDVVGDGQHAVLQREQLGQRVVEEGRAEGDVRGRLAVVGEAHLEFPRGLALDGLLLGLGLRRCPRGPRQFCGRDLQVGDVRRT